MIGKTVSHYKIISKIGEGGMGEVWEAHDTRLDRDVAIKLIPRHLSTDPAARTRFVHEAKAASSIEHANICTIHEIDETPEGETFIVMPRYQGELLSDRIARGRVPLEEALHIVEDLAGALAEAHDHGIIHRDVKPANIIIDSHGRPILLDFGLAKLTEQTKVTKTGTTVGTLAYMAPEQAMGKEVDGRADLFSLGVILYELLTGVRPFRGDHDAAVLYSIAHEPAPPLASHDPELPAALQTIVDRCLAKEPNDRYANLHDLKNAIADFRRQLQSAPTTNHGRGRTVQSKPRWVLPAVALVVVVAALVVWKFLPRGANEASDEGAGSVKLVVLPFENLGAPEDAFFADGITDEITSKLAMMRELRVISRTSAMKYRNTDKGLREIGEELGVQYVLEGTIRWDKRGEREKVRITPQLIKVSDDFHLWADSYEREIEEIFAVQAEIASQIADALDITLLASERHTLEARPTDNLDAYRAYLRGVDYTWHGDEREDNVRLGIQLLERAVKLDPEFALSYAVLSEAHALMYHYGYDRSEERLSQARAAVDKALDLQPELPEAHLALARYYYNGYRDYERAQEELAIAERGLPNHEEILKTTAYILRRQGEFGAAVDRLKRAFELSPQDHRIPYNIGVTFAYLREYEEAVRYYDLSISLAPDQIDAYVDKAYSYISGFGDTKGARDVFEKIPGENRDYKRQLSFTLLRLERNYQAVLGVASLASAPIVFWYGYAAPPALLAARAQRLMGELQLAHASFDSARAILEEELDAHPDDHRFHSALGYAYAGLGRKDDAIREGRRGAELLPVSKDAITGSYRVWDLAVIYTWVGEYDAALDEIEHVVSIPSWFSVNDLRLDPEFDPLRDHPRYQPLLEKYALK